jgi:hypothetical protein
MNQPDDLISTTEGRKLIGISTHTMARMIREGVIHIYLNPLDKREKLVSKSQIISLKPKRAEAA